MPLSRFTARSVQVFSNRFMNSVWRTNFARGTLQVATQVPLPVQYREVLIEIGFRLDLIVDDLVIVEIKAAERLMPVHEAQLLTYLKLARKRLGILINFNVSLIKDGIRRMAL